MLQHEILCITLQPQSTGYNPTELATIPQLQLYPGVDAATLQKFAHIKEDDVVVDLGSGGGH